MKIIAKTEDGFIVSMKKSHLEMLTGYYYGHKKFHIGEKIKIDSLYYQLQKLSNQEKEIKEISHKLKTAAGTLEKIDPIFYEETKKGG